MSIEEQDLGNQDRGHDGGPDLGAFIWRRLLVALAAAMLVGSLSRYLNPILGSPEHTFAGRPDFMVLLIVILCCEPSTMTRIGLIIVVASVTGALANLAVESFVMHFENLFVLVLGAGLITGFGGMIALLMCRLLGILSWNPFRTVKSNTKSDHHP